MLRASCLNVKSREGGAHGVQKAELNGDVDSETTKEAPQEYMYYGLDVHKKTISYCVKDASGRVRAEGTVGATRTELDSWMKNTSTAVVGGDGGNYFHRLDL